MRRLPPLLLLLIAAMLPLCTSNSEDFKKFSSESEFREYVVESLQHTAAWEGLRWGVDLKGIAVGSAEGYAGRYSQTNVQVPEIDEPDIVKTDGSRIYFSEGSETKVVDAYPPESMKLAFEIDDGGELFVIDGKIIVVRRDGIAAYGEDKLWDFDVNGEIVSARLYGDLYVVTRTRLNVYKPCPVTVGDGVVAKCTDIYHPIEPVPVDVVYTVLRISPEGVVKNKISFVGSYTDSVVYVSRNAVYIGYRMPTNYAELTYEFLRRNPDLVPKEVLERISRVMDYDISSEAKLTEIQVVLWSYLSTLDEEDRVRVEKEMWSRMRNFAAEHAREFKKTKIVKISLDMKPVATTEVPGYLLNQFSMDEYGGKLRVATSLGSTNDLYILDAHLNIIGKLTDFGVGERIYSVRFAADKAYAVTFRYTDPFFVIDLSNPNMPRIAGKLKIPGYSSYLHVLNDNLVLGIGKEGSWVKLSLFDVSNPYEPKEIDRFVFDEYWSEALINHHAFLVDEEKEIFFLPASHGYVFSYSSGLKLTKVIACPAKRAVYIDRYLYVVCDGKIVVYDEDNWQRISEIRI